jgi:hypothetical protein
MVARGKMRIHLRFAANAVSIYFSRDSSAIYARRDANPMHRLTSKVSKKLKLSKTKINYRKDERRAIHRRVRLIAKAELRGASVTTPVTD